MSHTRRAPCARNPQLPPCARTRHPCLGRVHAVSFRLPGVRPPTCRVELAHADDASPELHLDTVLVDADADRVHLLYRAQVPLRDGPHDVRTIALEEHVAPVRAPVPWRPGAAV